MDDEFIRKCVPRDRKGERWNVELPIGWVKEIKLQNSRLKLKKIGNSIVITKLMSQMESSSEKFKEEKEEYKPVESSTSTDDKDGCRGEEIESTVKGTARWVYD